MTTFVPPSPRPRLAAALAAASFLALLVVVAFWPTLQNGWVEWDDRENYIENIHYRGLGLDQLRWAATTYHVGVYQPMSWVICSAEYLVFGMDARGYHLASLILHAVNAGLLFALVRALVTRGRPDLRAESPGLLDLGAFLATALFAVHPLRVEVVAWNSCQQYLPAAFFSMLAVLAYLRSHPPDAPSRPGWVAASWCLLLLGMMSKAAAVGVAGALIVIDAYPLRRLGGGPGRWFGPGTWRVWAEKVPFLAMAGVFSVQAIRAKIFNHTLVPMSESGIGSRAAQASFGVFFYPFKTFVPVDLCTNYHLPDRYNWYPSPGWPAILGLLVVSCAMVIAWKKGMRALAASWAAYVVLQAPSLGAVRIGTQYAADRYCYFATIPWVALLAGTVAILARRRTRGALLVAAALTLIATLSALSWRQTRTWHDSESLAVQVLASNPTPPPETLNALGRTRARRGAHAKAEALYQEALRIDPGYVQARVSLGLLRLDQNRVPEAVDELRKAVRIRPDDAEAHNNLGAALGRLGRVDEATGEFSEAVRLDPHFAPALENLRKVAALRGGHAP